MDLAGKDAIVHFPASRFHRFRVNIAHRARAGAGFVMDQRAREFHPIACLSRDFQRVEQQIIGGNLAKRRNFEMCFGFAASSAKNDVHHARAGTAREETLDGRGHDFSFGFAGLIGFQQRIKAVENDVHGVAHAYPPRSDA